MSRSRSYLQVLYPSENTFSGRHPFLFKVQVFVQSLGLKIYFDTETIRQPHTFTSLDVEIRHLFGMSSNIARDSPKRSKKRTETSRDACRLRTISCAGLKMETALLSLPRVTYSCARSSEARMYPVKLTKLMRQSSRD